MADEIGLAAYPGILKVRKWRYVQRLGTRPDYCILEIVPQATNPTAKGLLRLTFGFNTVDLPECVIDWATLQYNEQGQITRVYILDRRWKWQAGGEISGLYNVRLENGALDPDLEKTPRELAALLLEEMGEFNYDVSLLPNDSRPEVDWVCAHPATELDRLLDQLGCRLSLGFASQPVQVWPVGTGNDLPNTDDIQSIEFGLDPPQLPDKLKVCGGPTVYQGLLKLEAVGLDVDGKVKLIRDLSYNPGKLTAEDPDNPTDTELDEGWDAEDPRVFPTIAAKTDKQEELRLAVRTVYKWYRVKELSDETLDVPGYDGEITSIQQIFPIREELVQTWQDADTGVVFRRPAFVQGKYYRGAEFAEPLRNTDLLPAPDPDGNTGPFEPWELPFSIRTGSGIVMLDDSAVLYNVDGDNKFKPAELYLHTSFNVKDKDTKQVDRATRELDIGGNNGTGPKVFRREWIARTCYAKYSTSTTHDAVVCNDIDVEDEMDAVLQAKMAEYSVARSYVIRYRGLYLIRPDGAVRQVALVGGVDMPGCHTIAAWNSEPDPSVFTFRETRAIADRRLDGRAARIALRNQSVDARKGTV